MIRHFCYISKQTPLRNHPYFGAQHRMVGLSTLRLIDSFESWSFFLWDPQSPTEDCRHIGPASQRGADLSALVHRASCEGAERLPVRMSSFVDIVPHPCNKCRNERPKHGSTYGRRTLCCT
ncbi:hypothetical protein PAXRUDRAFT_738693 [Paxillus rubicundulus Ve08.2h10]|uniref:Unplaced genomic scaffold scaffold_89, whole genome shotgun sequence n=1 Tax=Paxillus rubicundulus Ve08.2h10 TaxID=930991 RepID=A0A0D0DUJ6_9AGAM|nr:hypothetical protein PAXRUDRAFT_738693 [Paxillus rubicundulus Ve08.2h10]